jgi:hypothetical protein
VSAVDGFVWLEWPETGARWRCPVDAAPMWQARGLVPCDEPEPVDPAIAERQAPPRPDVPADAPVSKPTRSKTLDKE